MAEDVKERVQKQFNNIFKYKIQYLIINNRNILKRAGFKATVARKNTFGSLKNRMKHLAFANEHLNKPLSLW